MWDVELTGGSGHVLGFDTRLAGDGLELAERHPFLLHERAGAVRSRDGRTAKNLGYFGIGIAAVAHRLNLRPWRVTGNRTVVAFQEAF